MAGAWALISAKQCVLVSDCVVFVREMGRLVSVLLDADFICDTVWVRWGCLIRLDYVVGWRWWVGLFYAPFFISGLFGWCVVAWGWRVRWCNVINGRFV